MRMEMGARGCRIDFREGYRMEVNEEMDEGIEGDIKWWKIPTKVVAIEGECFGRQT